MRGLVTSTALTVVVVLLALGETWGNNGYQGSETCATCHEDTVHEFLRTAHATAAGWNTETGCEQCHGPGQAHVEAEDGTAIQRLRDLPPHQASQTCMECHKKDAGGL